MVQMTTVQVTIHDQAITLSPFKNIFVDVHVAKPKKWNAGFGPFIRAGVATPGFRASSCRSRSRSKDGIYENLTYGVIRNALICDYG